MTWPENVRPLVQRHGEKRFWRACCITGIAPFWTFTIAEIVELTECLAKEIER